MNYFLKRHSRLMTILLALTLLLTLLAGCQRKEAEDTSDPTENKPGLVVVDPTTEPTTEPTEETEPINENMAIVKDQLNVRSAPTTGAKIIGYLDPGMVVEIIKTQTNMGVEWALIREGWIVMDYVEMLNGDSTEPDETQPEETKPQETTTPNPGITTSVKGTITANGLYIRKEANKNGEIVGSYAKGTVVTILETKNGWGRTDKGWISMDYVKTDATTTTTPNTTPNTTVDGSDYFITGSELNIRSEASTNGNIVGQYKAGDKVTIQQTKDGWGKTDKGWISLQYAYKPGETGKNTAKGIVTGDGLNVRSGPGTNYNSVGSMKTGDRVNILEQITIGGTTWGCTEKGWISLGYVYIDGTKGDGAGTGTVTGDQVNIRSGPGTQYGSVGSVNSGDTVEILAQFTFGDTTWGCTSKGWICMDYVGVG